MTYPLVDDSSTDLFFTFAWDGSNSPGNQYYVPMNIIYDHNMIIRYRSYGFNQSAIKNKIQELINAIPTVGTKGENINILHPSYIEIEDVYPNPFNAKANLSFIISENTIANVTIYNSLGREVLELVKDLQLEAGKHTIRWHPNEKISSGLYIVMLDTPLGRDVRKVVLLK